MVFCDHCDRYVAGYREDDSYLACENCGKVLDDNNYSTEVTFYKNAAGQSKLSGTYVKSVQNEFSASRERTLNRALNEMKALSFRLGVQAEDTARQALAFFEIALNQNFTRGRRSELVQAACLYIAFRYNKKPYLLIDFSIDLRINVYVLGDVYLQLCQVLRLDKHPFIQKAIDPSVFLYKYTNNLLGSRNNAVTQTALQIIARMNRDWLQTGRKPNGLFGAALYVSAISHGFKYLKTDIIRLVHVCEATLTKRLVEFENTDSSSLTVEELNTMEKEYEKNPVVLPNNVFKGSASKDLMCEHKDSGIPYFALGLCETCYKDFDKLSGGFGGLDPPAFQRAERERVKKTLPKESAEVVKLSNSACKGQKEDLPASALEWDDFESKTTKGDECYDSHREDDTSVEAQNESENFSDIDDEEIDRCLLSEQEKPDRKIVWENNNREYLQEQAAKEAAAAAEKKLYEENLKNCPEASRELYESATAAVTKSKKEMRQRRAQQAKNSGPAQSAAEAACQMMKRKRLSKKVNLDLLAKLFEDEPVDAGSPKRVRFDLSSDNHGEFQSKVQDQKDDKLRSADDFEDGDMDGYNNEYLDGSYFPQEDCYGYGYDDNNY